MPPRATLVLAFLLVQIATSALYLFAVAQSARALRLAVVEYSLGFGPIVARVGRVTLRAIPWSCYFLPVTRHGLPPVDDDSPLGRAIAQGALRRYDDLPFPVGVGLTLLSFLVPFVGAAACLGLAGGAAATAACVRGYVGGALGPLATAPALLDGALSFWRDGDARVHLGWLVAAMAGINVLWTPSNVMMLLGLAARESAWARIRFLAWLAWKAGEVSWIVGLVAWLATAR